MGNILTWLYLIGVPVLPIYGLRLWVLEARELKQPVTKGQFGEAVVMCSLLGIIWPVGVVMIVVGLAIDWWLDRA